jgi:hypothetical protein
MMPEIPLEPQRSKAFVRDRLVHDPIARLPER